MLCFSPFQIITISKLSSSYLFYCLYDTIHHIYFITCTILSVDVTDFAHLLLCVWNRRLNNNSLSGPIPKSLTAITALQVL